MAPFIFLHEVLSQKEDFITYLRQFDTKVAENKNQARPYLVLCLKSIL